MSIDPRLHSKTNGDQKSKLFVNHLRSTLCVLWCQPALLWMEGPEGNLYLIPGFPWLAFCFHIFISLSDSAMFKFDVFLDLVLCFCLQLHLLLLDGKFIVDFSNFMVSVLIIKCMLNLKFSNNIKIHM